jgi:hypothetical protein
MTLYSIRLELARETAFPEGSSERGYNFIAPLDENGHLDAAAWRIEGKHCLLHRFWHGESDQFGRLIHTRGGHWAFSYDPSTDEDDEAIFRLDRHILRKGEYITVSEHGGIPHTFRIVSIQTLSRTAKKEMTP